MNTDLCIGIVATPDSYQMAALETGHAPLSMQFPATETGREDIRRFLAGRGTSMRLAVAGVAALSLALAVGNVSGRETFIVSTAVADQALALAHYAEHTV